MSFELLSLVFVLASAAAGVFMTLFARPRWEQVRQKNAVLGQKLWAQVDSLQSARMQLRLCKPNAIALRFALTLCGSEMLRSLESSNPDYKQAGERLVAVGLEMRLLEQLMENARADSNAVVWFLLHRSLAGIADSAVQAARQLLSEIDNCAAEEMHASRDATPKHA